MELTENEFIEKYGKKVCIVQETIFYHLNVNTFVFLVDTKLWNGKMDLQKSNEKNNFYYKTKVCWEKQLCLRGKYKIHEV